VFPSEHLETPRLHLRRPVAPEDAPRIFESYASDPRVTRYLTWRPHYDVAESHRILRTRVAWWNEGREFSWVMTTKPDGATIGMISATNDGCPWRYSLGYVLAHSHWGRGLMTEGARSVVEHLFTLPAVLRVWAVVDCENTASVRVLEKAGMEREGLLRRWSVHPAISHIARDCWCLARIR
jgi:RimJ/RimL family protein N-acetyltransferase